MGWVLTALRALLALLGLASKVEGAIHDAGQRQAGRDEQSSLDHAEADKRLNESNAIDDQVAQMNKAELDRRLK